MKFIIISHLSSVPDVIINAIDKNIMLRKFAKFVQSKQQYRKMTTLEHLNEIKKDVNYDIYIVEKKSHKSISGLHELSQI